MKNLVLIVAAGTGKRFGGGLPKQYRKLHGKAVLQHSIETFLKHPNIDLVRVVIAQDDENYKDLKLNHEKLLEAVIGGLERHDSVKLGLESLIEFEADNILIHDAARPYVTEKIITDMLAALHKYEAVIPVISVTDSIRYNNAAVNRDNVKLVQTPQGFNFQVILKAHQQPKTHEFNITDDAQLVEKIGVKIHMIEGDIKNTKITTMDDIKSTTINKVGTGFDVHGFEEGDAVTICGIKIPHHKKLKGHSDADVGIHAIVDAILGAIGEGDIGEHFPPSDNKWKNADSIKFLEYARDLVVAKNAVINNIDVTIICEEPKLSEYKAKMRERIAEVLEIPPSDVNVKATTTEKLGFTGRKEGIAAQAIASVSFLS